MENRIETILGETLQAMVKEKASDLYLKPGRPPVLRVNGKMISLQTPPLSAQETIAIADQLMSGPQQSRFQKELELNLVQGIPEIGRFRINFYKQRGLIALVFRRVEEKIPSIEELELPPILKEISSLPSGLILITGPSGSGKTTTLAALINWINENRSGHIITVEDPIEFLHPDKNCLVSQREIGVDTLSFAEALKNAVRQTPDVILIGEMRDSESVSSAVLFAETGHLVLSSLHATSVNQALERIVGFFPSEIHAEMLMQLSLNTRAIITQRLAPRLDGKSRAPVIEVLLSNARIRELLQKGSLSSLKKEIDLFQNEGMCSMDTALLKLYQENQISLQTALSYADSPNDFRLRVKMASTGKSIASPAGANPAVNPAS